MTSTMWKTFYNLYFGLTIAFVVFLGTTAVLAAQRPHPAVCRVVVEEQMGQAFGSGTLIDAREDYGLVVTNWHVVRDATGKIEVQFPSGFRSEARPVKLDETWDLAALVVWRPPTEPVRLANQAPVVGDLLTIHGYGQGDYRQAWGRCTDYYSPTQGMPQELVELNVEARQGDSGGPIFNAQGEMAGVLFGAGQGTTLGSFGGRVDQFLATLGEGIGKGAIAPRTMLANIERVPIVNQFAQADQYHLSLDSPATSSVASVDPFLAADQRAKQKVELPLVAKKEPPAWLPPTPQPIERTEPMAPITKVAELAGPTKKTAVHTLAVPELSIATGSWGPTQVQPSTDATLPTGPLPIGQVPTPAGIDLQEEGRTILALVGLIALAVQGVRATAS